MGSMHIGTPIYRRNTFCVTRLEIKSWPTFEGDLCPFAVYRLLMFMTKLSMNPFHFNVY